MNKKTQQINSTQTTSYKMLDGKIFEATNSSHLIKQMRADALNPEESLRAYMISVSKSSYEYNHSNININSAENFVKDLIKYGFVENFNK